MKVNFGKRLTRRWLVDFITNGEASLALSTPVKNPFLYYYYSKQTKVSISSGACISSAAFFESSAKLGILALL